METKARCKSFYQESRADKLQKVEVTRRSAIATYKIEDLYLMYIAAYLPTNANSNEGFNTALMDVRQAIVGAKRKYKNFSKFNHIILFPAATKCYRHMNWWLL